MARKTIAIIFVLPWSKTLFQSDDPPSPRQKGLGPSWRVGGRRKASDAHPPACWRQLQPQHCLQQRRPLPSLGSSRQSSAGRSGIYCVSGAFKLNIDLTDNTEKIQRLYLALEAVIDDHREYGSAGEGSLWSRLAVYVEAVLKNLFIELSIQVKRSDWSSYILDQAKFYKLS